MSLSTLRSKARKNLLEVEHILTHAKARTPGLKEELQRLSQELNWSSEGLLADGTRVVPFARWATVAGVYAEGGAQALAPFVDSDANFVIAMLEEVHTEEALGALIDLFLRPIATPKVSLDTRWRLVTAFNMLLAAKNPVDATPMQEKTIRDFLLACFPHAIEMCDKAWVIYALRGVGDEDTLLLLADMGDLAPPYETARKKSISAIRKKLRTRSA